MHREGESKNALEAMQKTKSGYVSRLAYLTLTFFFDPPSCGAERFSFVSDISTSPSASSFSTVSVLLSCEGAGTMRGADSTALYVRRASACQLPWTPQLANSRARRRTVFAVCDSASLAKFAGTPRMVALLSAG